MPTYCFACPECKHEFVKIFHGYPSSAVLQTSCEKCKKPAKRNFETEIKSQNVVGLTPIRPSDSKFSVGRETQYAFGKFKERPDGKVDKNHSPFGNTAELDKFMNGANNLGPPVIGDDGNPIRTGTVNPKTGQRDMTQGRIKQRKGAKLFKYDKNYEPPRFGPPISKSHLGGAEWSADEGKDFQGGVGRGQIYKR